MTSDSIPHFYVYVLLSLKDHKFYVGFTEDLRRRFQEHTLGKVISTKNRRPLHLIHYEMYITKEDAKAREVFLKSGFGREQLRQSIKQTLINYSVSSTPEDNKLFSPRRLNYQWITKKKL